MSKYVRISKGLYDKGQLVLSDQVSDLIDDKHDWYVSTYNYNEQHLAYFKQYGTIKGIRDVTSNSIWLDFDDKVNPSNAQVDALESVNRLLKLPLVTDSNIEIYYSGGKGFHVILNTNKELTPTQIKSIAINNLGKGLKTFDTSLYDSSQLLRVPGTKHKDTKLFKIPLTLQQLKTLNIDQIKELATSLDNIQGDFTKFASNVELDIPKEQTEKKEVSISEIDWSSKPKNWKNCKWSLLQGDIPLGKRHESLLILASTCKALGNSKDMAYDLVKGALRRSIEKHGQGSSTKEEAFNIVESVYDDFWQGGTYTCRTPGFLQTYCDTLGEHKCDRDKQDQKHILGIEDMFKEFEHFAKNFDDNIVKTGITELDENVMFLTSTHNGILGQPGSGKTSFLIQWLKNLSNSGQLCLFYSLDMAIPIICAKLIQTVTGFDFKKAMKIAEDDPQKYSKIYDDIREQYKNVKMIFRSGSTPESIKDDIKSFEAEMNGKVRFIAVDYLECMTGPYADATANTGFISNQMKDLASEMKVCSVMLLQTQKHSVGSDVSSPLLSMKQIKGSSTIEQSCSVVLTMWREGYNPKYQEHDRYISFAAVKNRFGPLWTNDFRWNGPKGFIGNTLSLEELEQLEELRNLKKAEKEADSNGVGRF